jgi:hypothetical protein
VTPAKSKGREPRRAKRDDKPFIMNEQIVELDAPGLSILLHSPESLSDCRKGKCYVPWLPDGRDLVDHVNDCGLAAFGVRWAELRYFMHFSAGLDRGVIARASDHIRLGIRIVGGQLHVRGGEDLFRWDPSCPQEQIVSIADGLYDVTACMLPYDESGYVEIFVGFAPNLALPELGYAELPELYCEAPVL